MNYYYEIECRPDPDFVSAILLNALFSKLHRFLAEHADLNIGVSFPQYSIKPLTLGERIRLHGNQADLAVVHQGTWLTGMHDHVDSSEIAVVPLR